MIVVVIIGLLETSPAMGKTLKSPFNEHLLGFDKAFLNDYSFMIAGHMYGSGASKSIPSSSLLANLDMINKSGANFFISLGDAFQYPKHISQFKKDFTSKLKMPFFNAVGNHDVLDRNMYETNFGKTYFNFTYKNELFIFLDTEIVTGNIIGDQLEYFYGVIEEAINNPDIYNVFILSHKLIWSIRSENFKVALKHLNTTSTYPDTDNFKSDIKPELIKLSQHKPVYWISGDIGGHANAFKIFYGKDPIHDITYIATGIGDSKYDMVIQTNIKNRKVTFDLLSLGKQNLLSIEHYGVDYWKDYFSNQHSRLPKLLQHPFRIVFILSLLVVGLIILGFWFKYIRRRHKIPKT